MPRGDGTGPAFGRVRGHGRRRGMRRGRRRSVTGPTWMQPPGPGVAGRTTQQLGTLLPLTRTHTAPVAKVNEDACVLCGACQAACPTEAISLGDTAAEIHSDKCCGCGACVAMCPRGAIELT